MRKFTLCLWLIIGFLATTKLAAQEKIRLSEAFDLIEDQSGHTVAYNENLLNVNKRVKPSTSDLSLEENLRNLLRGTGMQAQISGKIILIVPKKSGEEEIEQELSKAYNVLDEAIVVGYGKMQRKDISSAIGVYNIEGLEGRAFSGGEALLQGRIAGVNIQASSGSLSSRNRVSIRGIGSLTAGNEPLYVIDGIPLSNTISDAGGWDGEQINALADINPDDIESIQVLKDAAAAAIYGSRATNGVIVITTKQGKKGAPKVTAEAGTSLSYIPNLNKLKIADADLYLQVQNEAIDNYNIQTGGNVAHIINPYPDREQFSWVDLVLRTAVSWKGSASISGGSDKNKYYISANAKHNQGVIIGSKAEKYGIRANFETKIKNWLSSGINFNANYSYTHHVPNGNMGTSMLTHALEHRPWDTPYKEDGSYNVKDIDLLHYNLMQALNEQKAYNKNYRATGRGFIQIRFMDGLTLKSSAGGDFMYAEDYVYYGSKHMYGNSVGKLTDARKVYTSIVVDNLLNYKKEFANGLHLDAMLGHSFQQDASSVATQVGQGFPSDDFVVNSVAAEYINMKTSISKWSIQSFMSRINLNYRNRYLVTASARTDGSSKFTARNRYGFFPSISLGWNVSNETFWNNSGVNMKIRASAGMTGNQGGIGDYAWQPLANGGYNYIGENGIGLTTQGNEDLRWEKASQYNLGVDLSFYDGKLTATTDIYRKDTKDLLYNKPISATSGFTNQICNIGAMRNDGLEITLGSNLSTGDFRWQGNFNISFVKNQLTELIDDDGILASGSYHALKVGEEVGSFYMIKMIGIYQSDEEVPAKQYAQGVRAGDVIYEDVNKDGDIDTVNDSQFVGSANPIFTGGLSSMFTWKGFDLSFLLSFSYGNKLYQTWTGGLRLGNGLWPSQESEALARWTGPGTSYSVPRAIYGITWNSTKFINTRYLHDASYLRCRNVSLGYSLPKHIVKRIGMESLRVFVQADNLFLISPYRFIDPEVNSTLDATKMGLDNMWLPQSRTFSTGVKIKF